MLERRTELPLEPWSSGAIATASVTPPLLSLTVCCNYTISLPLSVGPVRRPKPFLHIPHTGVLDDAASGAVDYPQLKLLSTRLRTRAGE